MVSRLEKDPVGLGNPGPFGAGVPLGRGLGPRLTRCRLVPLRCSPLTLRCNGLIVLVMVPVIVSVTTLLRLLAIAMLRDTLIAMSRDVGLKVLHICSNLVALTQ